MLENKIRLVLIQDAPNAFAVIPQSSTFIVVVSLRNDTTAELITPNSPIMLCLTLFYESKSNHDSHEKVPDQHILKCLSPAEIGCDGRGILHMRINENSNNTGLFERGKASTNHENRKFVIRISLANSIYHDVSPVDTSAIYIWARNKETRRRPPSSTGTILTDQSSQKRVLEHDASDSYVRYTKSGRTRGEFMMQH